MASSEKVTPIIRWPGGKRLLASHILPLIPDHHCYVEPFGGGMAVLLAKPKSKLEVYNDVNGALVALFRVVKYHPEALVKGLALQLNSREEYGALLAQPGLTDIQRAARFMRANHSSFGGLMRRGYAVGRKSGGGANHSRESDETSIWALNARLDRVNIEHLDWRRCMGLYDSPATAFYLDPPYADGDQTVYADPFTEQDHLDLATVIRGLEGRWVLSYGDHPLIRDLYQGCTIREVVRTRGINNAARRPYTELIIAA